MKETLVSLGRSRHGRVLLPALAALGLLCQLNATEASDRHRTCSAEPTDDFVRYGDLMTCDIDPASDSDNFRFAGTIGEGVVIQVSRLTGATTVCLELIRPDGTTLAPRQCGLFTRLDAALDQSGQYSIRVAPGAVASITYSLVVDRVGPASPVATQLDPGASIDEIISPEGEIDSYAFQGELGDTVSIVYTNTSGGTAVTRMQLFDPDGALLTPNDNLSTINRTLDQSGIYSVLVYEGGNNQLMTYRFDYSCSGVCPSLDLKKRYIDTASIEDMNGNGSPESVALFQPLNNDQTRLIIKDGDTWETIKTLPVFYGNGEPVALAAVGDRTGDLIAELGVLGVNLNSGAVVVWTVDPVMEDVTSQVYFDSGYSPLGFSKFEDLNGDGTSDVGVLALEKATGVTKFKVRDGVTGGLLTIRNWPK